MTGYIFILGLDKETNVMVDSDVLARKTSYQRDRVFQNQQPKDVEEDYIALFDCGKTPDVTGDVEVTVLGECEVGRMHVQRVPQTTEDWTSMAADIVNAAEVFEETTSE